MNANKEVVNKKRIMFVSVIVLLAAVGLLSTFWKGNITGLVVAEEQTTIIDTTFNETTTLSLNASKITSLKASGTATLGLNSSARVYYQNLNGSLFLVLQLERRSNETFSPEISFDNACIDTCNSLLQNGSLMIVVRGENTTLRLSNITYSTELPTGNIQALTIPDINLSNSTTLNLSTYFIETSNHPLTFNAIVPEQVRSVLFDDVLFLSERESGVFNATVIASNGVVNASSSFLITVNTIQNVTNESIGNSTTNETINQTNATIDEKIKHEFLNKPKVPVIILLKEPAKQFTGQNVDKQNELARKRAEVDIVQDALVKDLETKEREKNNRTRGFGITAQEPTFKITKKYDAINAFAAEVTSEALTALQHNPDVEAVIYDFVFNISLQDSIPLVGVNDTHTLFDASNESIAGNGQSVCVLDTGVDYAHPALADKILNGFDFVNNDLDVMDDNVLSHGTHVAGIVSAVVPSARIVVVKVCDAGGGCLVSNVLAGIDFCVNRSVELNVSVVSASLGDGGRYDETSCPDWFDSVLATADSFGITNIFASGNNGFENGVSYPSCSPYSVSVGASDKSDAIASFTNRGSRLDFLAPGVGINSTVRGGGYGTLSGTSMATPFVSGSVALLKQVAKAQQQTITLNETKQLLKNTGVSIGQWKRIDVLKLANSILTVTNANKIVLFSNIFDGENWTITFNASGTNNLVITPANGTVFKELPNNNLTLNDAEFVSLQNNQGIVNVTLVDSGNNTLPYNIYSIKQRIEAIKKRLGELG